MNTFITTTVFRVACTLLCVFFALHEPAIARQATSPHLWEVEERGTNSSEPIKNTKYEKKLKSKSLLFSVGDDSVAQNEESLPFSATLPSSSSNLVSEASIPVQSGTVRRVITIPEPSATPPATTAATAAAIPPPATAADHNTVFVRLADVSAVEFVRIVSNAANRNFIFDEIDLDFNVTVISEEPTTVSNLMTMLLQELRIHGLNLIEEGNNLIIHRNPKVNSISRVIDDTEQGNDPIPHGVEIITQIFRLNTLGLEHAVSILTPLASNSAIIEAVPDGNQLVVTDLATNVAQMKKLLRTIDAPKGGLVVGQYVAKNTALETLIALAEKILLPMAKEQPLVFVPHPAAGSIFVVSTPFFVERSLAILEHIDQTQGETGIYDEKARKMQQAELKPGGEKGLPSPQELQNIQEGVWSDVNGRKAFRPKLLPGDNGEQPPTGQWTRDAEGRWKFEASPTGTVGGIPRGAKAVGGQWVIGPNGEWQYEGGERPQLPASGLPPMGTWYKDDDGQFRFEDAKNYLEPEEGMPPLGIWLRDDTGNWIFDQLNNYGMPKGGLPPKGRWYRDEVGNWQFERTESGLKGGIPDQAIWVRSSDGMWGIIPSSIPENSRNTFPEGVWYFNEQDGSWQFMEGRRLDIPEGSPPMGSWGKNNSGLWEFQSGEGSVGGTPSNGFWNIDPEGNWRYVVKDNASKLTYPAGFWIKDKKGYWKFQESPQADMTPGGLPAGGSWLKDIDGSWSTMPGSVPPDSVPEGFWKRNADAKWVFTPHKLQSRQVPPGGHWSMIDGEWKFTPDPNEKPGGGDRGVWTIDEGGHWRFIGKENKAPTGFWSQDAQGKWKFKEFKQSEFSAGGAGPEANWILDKDGNWALMPGSNGADKLPGGVWQYGADKKWQFLQGKKPNLPGGGPPKGKWVKNAEGVLEFMPGNEEVPFPGGGVWTYDNKTGGWRFIPTGKGKVGMKVNSGVWLPSDNGWSFVRDDEKWILPESNGAAPKGVWVKDANGKWVFILNQGEAIQSRRLVRPEPTMVELPLGHIERTQFYIYKLQFRNGEQIQDALRHIAESLYSSNTTNEELINALNSVQWLDSSNSLVFTGTNEALRKVRELVEELDRPLRQIFLDMLIMQVGIDDSLEYGVTWASAFGNPNSAGAQTFSSGATSPVGGLVNSGIVNGVVQRPGPFAALPATAFPGYTLGVVGQAITHGGTSFGSISAVVRAQHDNQNSEVIMNPKILTEDNATAELFVGITQPFKTQSIANDQGSTITTSFDFRDVGTRLQVTPIIGDNDVITLEIRQEISQSEPTPNASGNVNVDPPPTISKITATTRVHVPNNYFLVMSGMIQDTLTKTRSQVPCLGGIPFIGGLFSRKLSSDSKRNLMIFMNPRIIDTDEDIQNITKHEQDLYRVKKKMKGGWRFEVDEALDFLNVRELDLTSAHDKMLSPSCTMEDLNVKTVEEEPYFPCEEAGSALWRDNRRLYH